MSEYTDMLGNVIRVGDFVVYATTSRRSPVQKFAKVEKINVKQKSRYREGFILEYYDVIQIGVREISNGRGFIRWDSHDWKDGGNPTKQVRVTYPLVENIVKVRDGNE